MSRGLAFALGSTLFWVGLSQARELKIVTSILPLYCFAANIVGSNGQVNALISANGNPHDYQMSIRDRRQIDQADFIILNGLGLDSWLEPAIHRAGKDQAVLIATSLLSNQLIRVGSITNPHAWLDPELATLYVTSVLREISQIDPENQKTYAKNASDFSKQLQQLDQELKSTLAPYKGSAIVTFHDSFRYFARRYDLQIAGVIEEVPDVSPSARYLSQLYRTIRAQNVKCIFAEPGLSPRLAEQISRDLKIPIAVLDPLETGPLDLNRYEVAMRQNLQTLRETLR